MKLNEIFEQAYPWKWTVKQQARLTAEFTPDDGGKVATEIMYKGEGQWSFEFSREDDSSYRFMSTNITGQGDAFRIFATIIEMIQSFVSEYDPHYLYFTAHEPSRQRLYRQLLPRIAKSVGMEYKTYEQADWDEHQNEGPVHEFVLIKR